MLKLYRNAAIAFFILIAITAFIIYAGVMKSHLNASLFPTRDSNFLWVSAVAPKSPVGKTTLSLKNEVGTVEYDFFLDHEKPYPYTHYTLDFIDAAQSFTMVDLTRYSSISFRLMCDPKNLLSFVLSSFDEKLTDIKNPLTRRVSQKVFSCDIHWNTITIAFDEIDTPQWWLTKYGYEHSDTGYQLNKTMSFSWVNSLQSPHNTHSHVKLTDIKLLGTDARYIYVAVALSLCLWISFLIWFFRQYVTVLTADLKEKVKRDQTLLAYKKLTIEPQKDKEKIAVLRFIATEYTNRELSIELVTTTLGINRFKINDILKEELGLTFIVYLNKLRLTEAARLLSENKEVSVSEIAYAVGYNNVTYFNKLFKAEYNCAPKTFKELYQANSSDEHM
jgi:AraC-like DNA-binding protein